MINVFHRLSGNRASLIGCIHQRALPIVSYRVGFARELSASAHKITKQPYSKVKHGHEIQTNDVAASLQPVCSKKQEKKRLKDWTNHTKK